MQSNEAMKNFFEYIYNTIGCWVSGAIMVTFMYCVLIPTELLTADNNIKK